VQCIHCRDNRISIVKLSIALRTDSGNLARQNGQKSSPKYVKMLDWSGRVTERIC
jgi:hypothetical protein